MHPCPCCGYRTLPGRADYDLCPVCWWEDDGGQPWELSGPNGRTLIEGQQEFLADRRPYRRRPGPVRAPKAREARDPDWRPYELTDDVRARIQHAHEADRRQLEESVRRADELAVANDPFEGFNAGLERLRYDSATLTNQEVEARLRDLLTQEQMMFPRSYVELVARTIKDERYYRHHPLQAIWWLLRYARPGTFSQRWAELRTGTFRLAG